MNRLFAVMIKTIGAVSLFRRIRQNQLEAGSYRATNIVHQVSSLRLGFEGLVEGWVAAGSVVSADRRLILRGAAGVLVEVGTVNLPHL